MSEEFQRRPLSPGKTRETYIWAINKALAGYHVGLDTPNEERRDEWAARFVSSDLTPSPDNPYKFSFKLGGSIQIFLLGEP